MCALGSEPKSGRITWVESFRGNMGVKLFGLNHPLHHSTCGLGLKTERERDGERGQHTHVSLVLTGCQELHLFILCPLDNLILPVLLCKP